jgi:hypothetical protein
MAKVNAFAKAACLWLVRHYMGTLGGLIVGYLFGRGWRPLNISDGYFAIVLVTFALWFVVLRLQAHDQWAEDTLAEYKPKPKKSVGRRS